MLDPTSAVIVGVILVAGLLSFISLAKSLLHICPPNEVLIFSGKNHKMSDGSMRGFRVVFGGRGWRIPVIETVDRMNLNVMEVPITIRNAYSKGGIPLNVGAIANIKISSDQSIIGNAIERFLGRDMEEVRRVAKETLEGHLRGVLATLTPEDVNEDRLKFAQELQRESGEDLHRLGIHLDTLKIQHVADDRGYLDAIGREAIANVIRDAQIAESDAERDAEQSEALQTQLAKVQQADAEAEIAKLKNELRRVKADVVKQVKSAEEVTTAAAREARAKAEQELQKVRAELAAIRLQIDQVMPAEAAKLASEYQAKGDAASIRERGNAVKLALAELQGAWTAAGEDALSIYLIEDIERILTTATNAVGRIKVKDLNVIDGGDGQTLAAYAAAYPAMLQSVFDAVAKTTGIDIPGALSGTPSGGGTPPPVRPGLGLSTGRKAGE